MKTLITLVLAASIGTTGFANEGEKADVTAHSFTMNSLDGKKVDLGKYKGKVMLAVNVASRCGYTPQYTGLQELHKKYGEKGLAVVGVPCNQFGRQEPGTANEIAEFCNTEYGVTFDMLEKVDVNGDEACELYQYLTAQEGENAKKGKIRWNFEKFLIGPDGKVIARFGSGTAPTDNELIDMIEQALASLN